MRLRSLVTGRGDPVLTWGVWVTLAYLVSQLVALGPRLEMGLMVVWTFAMLPPLAASYREARDAGTWKTLNAGWAALIAVGLLGNWVGMATVTDQALLLQSYYHKWFLFGVVGFAATAWIVNGVSSRIYGVAALLNAVALLLLEVNASFFTIAYLAAALVQGVPMLLDWHVHR